MMPSDDKSNHLQNHTVTDRQNWGLIIGVGVVTLCTLVMILNLFGHKFESLNPLKKMKSLK